MQALSIVQGGIINQLPVFSAAAVGIKEESKGIIWSSFEKIIYTQEGLFYFRFHGKFKHTLK